MKFLISKEALIVNIFLKTAIKLKENNLLKEVLKYQFSEQWRERRNKTAPLIKSQRLMRTLPRGCGRCSKIKTICNVCNLSCQTPCSSKCQNGQTCSYDHDNRRYACLCEKPYTGMYCEKSKGNILTTWDEISLAELSQVHLRLLHFQIGFKESFLNIFTLSI